jgi:hypothetical protein
LFDKSEMEAGSEGNRFQMIGRITDGASRRIRITPGNGWMPLINELRSYLLSRRKFGPRGDGRVAQG